MPDNVSGKGNYVEDISLSVENQVLWDEYALLLSEGTYLVFKGLDLKLTK